MAIGAQRLPIDPRERYGVDEFVLPEAQHLRNDGGGSDLHQHDVIEPNAVEAVFERKNTLDFMRLDHRRQYIGHG